MVLKKTSLVVFVLFHICLLIVVFKVEGCVHFSKKSCHQNVMLVSDYYVIEMLCGKRKVSID